METSSNRFPSRAGLKDAPLHWNGNPRCRWLRLPLKGHRPARRHCEHVDPDVISNPDHVGGRQLPRVPNVRQSLDLCVCMLAMLLDEYGKHSDLKHRGHRARAADLVVCPY